MGMIIETDDEILGLEERRESFNICDMKRVYPDAITPYRQVMPHQVGTHLRVCGRRDRD